MTEHATNTDTEHVLTGDEQVALMHHIGAWRWERQGLDNAEADFMRTVESIIAARVAARDAAARAEAVKVLVDVHWLYFDQDGEPGYDDTTPEPEDVWRYDRDFRDALRAAFPGHEEETK